MYIGAGLNTSSDSTSDSASRLRCPPLSSDSDSFSFPPNDTRTSSPSSTLPPFGGSSRAEAPGSSVEKMEPKSRFTFAYVLASVSRFFTSSSSITFSICLRSFSMISRFRSSSWYSLSAFSIIPSTFLFSRRPSSSCSLSSASTRLRRLFTSIAAKSKSPPL